MQRLLHIDPRKEFRKLINKVDKNHKLQLFIPVLGAFALFITSVLVTMLVIHILNQFLPVTHNLKHVFRWGDFALGTTIYLKTAIDFAILMTLYMKSYPGWKNRIAIEGGTTVGNTVGTIIVIVIWGLLQQFRIVLNIMVFYSAIILIKLAYETLDHVKDLNIDISSKYPLLDFIYDILLWPIDAFIQLTVFMIKITWKIIATTPLNSLIPNLNISTNESKKKAVTYTGLFLLTLGVPFALGLDDFAGYIGLLTVVNVLSFAIGVYFGHFLLNTFLFLNPKKTMKVIGHPIIAWIGSMALMLIAFLGLREVYETIVELIHHHNLIETVFIPIYYYIIHMPIQLSVLLGSVLVSLAIMLTNKSKNK